MTTEKEMNSIEVETNSTEVEMIHSNEAKSESRLR